MAGTRIGLIIAGPNNQQFELTDYLGAGAFGEVYRAEEKESGYIAAVKLLPLSGIQDPSVKQALLNEAQLATQISHPNVVAVLHVGEHSDLGPYVLMEYVPGQTLERFLNARLAAHSNVSLGNAIEIMLHIAQGARAINEKLVHRDIKPDNIIISGNSLKIADFGISKLVAARTRTFTFKGGGPIRYMAPEAWQSQENTPKMDIYSVGLVFHEIFTLQHPLMRSVTDPSRIEAWRHAHLFEAPQDIRSMRADIPRPLAQLLSRMVAKRPADRPAWDEVIAVLSSSVVESEELEDINSIVEKAISRNNRVERARLVREQEIAATQDIERLYESSFKQLISGWDNVVELFNAGFQGGTIQKRQLRASVSFQYVLPNASSIYVHLFPRKETDIKITGSTLIGGGVVGIDGAVSASLLLLKDSPEDLYGRWLACLVKLMVAVVPQQALAHLSRRPPAEPFGFQCDTDFYEHIRYAGGHATHIFTYELRDDLDGLFRDLLETAFSL